MRNLNYSKKNNYLHVLITILLIPFAALAFVTTLMCVISMFMPEVFNKIEIINLNDQYVFIINTLNLFGGVFSICSWTHLDTYKKAAILFAYADKILLFGYITAVLYQLKKVFQNIYAPFDSKKSKTIGNIAWIFIGYTTLNTLISIFSTRWYPEFRPGYLLSFIYFNTKNLAFACIFFILAGIFRYGCYLQTEYDETL